ncbi:MAG: glycosyltransferase [Patescibacteria group bacterium]
MKLCIITCYSQPDYIRAKTLRASAKVVDDVELIIVKNNKIGILRYPEVLLKVLRSRVHDKPDAYLLTFRGYEMLLPIRLLSIGKPLIYDEFINPIEWVVHERRQVEANQKSGKLYARIVRIVSRVIVLVVSSGLFQKLYRLLARSADLILTDTESHADVSAKLSKLSRDKFLSIPVGTDELTFASVDRKRARNDIFTVFYYGNMLPLHGLRYVIDAAVQMRDENVKFVLIGGNAKVAKDVAQAIKQGANIDYQTWVEFEALPGLMAQADLCLAGPFGGTFQAQYVITGKAYQYLAMGRPTVIGRNNESGLFNDKQNVLIAGQGSTDSLVSVIRWAAANETKLRVIGENGRALYQEEFSVEQIAKRLEMGLASIGRTKLGAYTDSK